MKAIAGQLGLKELRSTVIAGPGKGVRRPREVA
jgi:hypothetical protein